MMAYNQVYLHCHVLVSLLSVFAECKQFVHVEDMLLKLRRREKILDKEIGELLVSLENFAKMPTMQNHVSGVDLQDAKRSSYDNDPTDNTLYRNRRSLEVHYHPTRTSYFYQKVKHLGWRPHNRNHRGKVYYINKGYHIHKYPRDHIHSHHRRRHSRAHDRQKLFFERERNYHLKKRHRHHFYVNMGPSERTLSRRRLQISKRRRSHSRKKNFRMIQINKLKEHIQLTRQRHPHMKHSRSQRKYQNRIKKLFHSRKKTNMRRKVRMRKKRKYLIRNIINQENKRRRPKKVFTRYTLLKSKILKNRIKKLREKLLEKRKINIKMRQRMEIRCMKYKKKLQKTISKANHALRRATVIADIIGKKFGIDQKTIDEIIKRERGNISRNFFSIL